MSTTASKEESRLIVKKYKKNVPTNNLDSLYKRTINIQSPNKDFTQNSFLNFFKENALDFVKAKLSLRKGLHNCYFTTFICSIF